MALITVVILSWNVSDLLAQCLESLFAVGADDYGLEVIVVDSASADGTPAMVQARFPQVKLIASSENLGFSRGNNCGLAAAHGDYVLLLNPDTVVLGDAVSRLADHLSSHPDVGVVGPRLLNDDGSVQPSRRRFPNVAVLFFESTWLEPLAPRGLLKRFYVEDAPDDTAQNVDWLTGAALMVRRQVIDEVGVLDEGFFMYSEELDWCHRIRDAGWQVAYAPEASIVHYGGRSSDQVAPARHIYFQSSKVRYARKYHGACAAAALRYWLLGQYVWQLGLESGKWLLGHRRSLRAQRIAAYRRVLRSGLRQSTPLV